MKYEEIKTPEQLMNYMNENISYGIYDYTKNKAYCVDDDFETLVKNVWRLSSPKQLIKYKVGHCFDQVELEREFFKRNNYNFKHFISGLSAKGQTPILPIPTLCIKIK